MFATGSITLVMLLMWVSGIAHGYAIARVLEWRKRKRISMAPVNAAVLAAHRAVVRRLVAGHNE